MNSATAMPETRDERAKEENMLETIVRFPPAVVGMAHFLDPYRPWIDSVLSASPVDTVTFELDVPFAEVVLENLLEGAPLDRQCLERSHPLSPLVERWALPDNASPRILLELSRDRRALVTARELAWDPHWKEMPVAVWLRGLAHPLVAVRIPYVSYQHGLVSETREWLIARRDEMVSALRLLRPVLGNGRRVVRVIGGADLALPEDGYDWQSVVLDPTATRLLREDFEGFLAREIWFRRHRLPFRRGYFLYGPPGNGKTSIVRVMASHPAITAYALNFSNPRLNNGDLTYLFESAGRTAPSLVIFEDLDRLYGQRSGRRDNLTKVTLQHLLNCLDGLGSRDGVLVVGTANDPTVIDAAIVRRPGRFDRVVACRPPDETLRREYLRRLAVDSLDESALAAASTAADGFSYAQLREAFVLTGHLTYQRGGEEIQGDALLEAIGLVRGETRATRARVDARSVGFDVPTPGG